VEAEVICKNKQQREQSKLASSNTVIKEIHQINKSDLKYEITDENKHKKSTSCSKLRDNFLSTPASLPAKKPANSVYLNSLQWKTLRVNTNSIL